MFSNNRILQFLLIVTTCYIVAAINGQPKQKNQLLLQPSSAELLLNEHRNFTLSINPPLNESQGSIKIRFTCEDSDTDAFNPATQNGSNCQILNIPEGYIYTIEPGQKDLQLTVVASADTPGKQQLVAHQINKHENSTDDSVDTRNAYTTVNVGRSTTILVISAIVGWIYFAAWSVSFYPQIWENFKRRSVVGLNFDYIALNITGFLSYTAYNIALKYVSAVEEAFSAKHPRSQNPIELNDVFFGAHAVLATAIVIVQCFIYERADQTVSWFSRIFLGLVWTGYIVIGIVIQFSDIITLLDYIYLFSYVKLTITLIKYIPQGYYNFKRKSTVGWSIGNIFLDFTGGLLSMFQMFLLAYNYDDWITIMNNFTKFGLGLISILFDVFFLLQHYVFYRVPLDALHSSHAALLAERESSISGSSDDGGSLGKRPHRHLDTVPSLVRHIGYGATDSINTNSILAPSSTTQAKSPSWTTSPHTVIS